MKLSIAPALRRQIACEARAAFPRECCGLIEGTRAGETACVLALHPTRNLSAEPDAFEIDPAEHFRLLRELRGSGRDIVGCYHSHPNGRAEPSPRDREQAGEQGFVWLIAALDKGEVALGAYLWDGKAFAKMESDSG